MGETLTADTSSISDADGLTNVSYSYQWVGNDGTNDSDIPNATGSSYTLVDGDASKAIKVEVSFTDDDGNDESLTSAATAAVRPLLTATFESVPDSHDGTNSFDIRIRFSEQLKNQRLGSKVIKVTNGDNTASSRIDGDEEVWSITIEPDGNDDVTIRLASSDECGSGIACTTDLSPLSESLEHVVPGPSENSPATGAPAITGTALVGETLTSDTSGISDADGLTNVSYSYQWVRNDGTDDEDISNATNSTYILVDEDAGKTIKVKVSFTDDAGNQEALTSAATATVERSVQRSVTTVTPDSDPGNTLEDAHDLGDITNSTDTIRVEQEVDQDDDAQDYYKFTLTERKSVTITLTSRTPTPTCSTWAP